MRWQLPQWLSSMGEQKNPISSIYKAKRKMGGGGKKNLLWKKWNWGVKQKKTPLKKKERYRETDVTVVEKGAGKRHGKKKKKVGGETWASWLLNMRLFYSRAGIEWKCNKYIDIVFRGYLVAVAPMSSSNRGSRLSCLGAWWWPVTGSLSDEWPCWIGTDV